LEYLYRDDLDLPKGEVADLFIVELMEATSKYGLEVLKENLEFKLNVGLDLAPLRSQLPLTFSSSMKQFVNNKEYSDVTFDIEGQFIYGHKAILASRSDHFRALFTSGFKESTEDVIPITDTKASVFLAMLEYIYTDCLTIEDDDAVELLTSANAYSLERLKALCEDFVEKGLDVENAAWLLEIAERYDAQQLKGFCMYFLLNEFDAVSKTEGFQNLSQDVIEEISKHRKMPTTKTQNKQDDGKCNLQ